MSEDPKDTPEGAGGAYEAPQAEEIDTSGGPAETAAAAGSQDTDNVE